MYEKHAVWCQCALVFSFVLSAAALLSLQSMTIDVDIYWGVVLTSNSILQFIVAEHAPFFGISCDNWMKLDRIRNIVVKCILSTWSIFSWQSVWIKWLHIPMSVGLALVISNIPILLPTLVRICTHFDLMTVLLVLQSTLTYTLKTTHLQKSMASTAQKKRFALKTLSILLESSMLWYIRCEHRFPHVFRWKPFLFGIFCILGAIVWTNVYVKKTKVSENVIIVNTGHGTAASLIAAKACPICSSTLTLLDMESSFSN